MGIENDSECSSHSYVRDPPIVSYPTVAGWKNNVAFMYTDGMRKDHGIELIIIHSQLDFGLMQVILDEVTEMIRQGTLKNYKDEFNIDPFFLHDDNEDAPTRRFRVIEYTNPGTVYFLIAHYTKDMMPDVKCFLQIQVADDNNIMPGEAGFDETEFQDLQLPH